MSLEDLIEGWAAKELAENPVVLAVDREPEVKRWYVRLKGEDREFVTIWLTLGQRTLRYETYFMPAPEVNVESLFEYLLRLWDEIREVTLKSTAPALIYEEASLIKRSIRDLYTRDIGDIIVAGEESYRAARDFMRTLTPSHTRRVQAYRDQSQPLFQRYQIESQIAAIHEPVVHLKSGGYIVLNQTEALVAIDVNSGRATRERNIEETALKTNLEAAREIAKQLRLRDIGGIIVVDFIDLRDEKNRKKIYDELKKEFKKDQAKTNVIGMSDFGLVQITRQRIRPSVVNSVSNACPMCGGSGTVVSKDTIVTDIESWISKFRHSTEYRTVDIYVNPYLRSFLTKGTFNQRWKWMVKYKVKISLIPDESISLNEFKATLTGSEIEITDVVLQEQSIDEILKAHDEQQNQEIEIKVKDGPENNTLKTYSKTNRNGNGNGDGDSSKAKPRRPATRPKQKK